ncbi:MAG: GTPase ObgE, partial [Chloroflexi bacterium]|nr:GTPase ObgE [Chloroflexota bacterium]
FFDEATIVVKAGDGGNGCVSFRREKYIPFGGPNGGNGGRGGHVYLRVNPQLNTLIAFGRQKRFEAQSGGHGMGKGMRGAYGGDLYIDVPAGTVVRDGQTGEFLGDLTEDAQTLLVARGGRGGRGNEAFKSPTRQTPRFAEKGQPGEERTLRLELKLIADVGLVGKPNAGKSTLLASVSAARPKIADYPFTTLSPNLGVVEVDSRTFVMADIPGLIEGAHQGAGLGHQFLRHVERTRLLVHLLDGASPDPAADYRAIRQELALYSERLAEKPEIVVLNKMDLTEARETLPILQMELEGAAEVLAISAVTREGVQELLRRLVARLDELPSKEPEEEGLFVFRPHRQRESASFEVSRQGPGVYSVRGQEIERLAQMTDWSSEESLERFERILVARGISAQLEEAGVELGDTVYIGEIELEWR